MSPQKPHETREKPRRRHGRPYTMRVLTLVRRKHERGWLEHRRAVLFLLILERALNAVRAGRESYLREFFEGQIEDIPEDIPKDVNDAWFESIKQVEQMLLDSLDVLSRGQLTPAAVERFNALGPVARPVLIHPASPGAAANLLAQAHLELGPARERALIAHLAAEWAAAVPLALWQLIAAAPEELRRLKHCPQCARWFIDKSKNATAIRCTIACTNRYWNRARRRAANHKG